MSRSKLVATVAAVFMVVALLLPFYRGAPRAHADTWGKVAAGGIDGAYHPVQMSTTCMATFEGSLFLGTSSDVSCEVWKYDGQGWNQVNQEGFGDLDNENVMSMAVHDEELYAGTANEYSCGGSGCQVWRYHGGTDWTMVNSSGFGSPYNGAAGSMAVLEDTLYVGTSCDTDWGGNGCQVWRYDGDTSWTQVNESGFGESDNQEASAMAVFDGSLYVGTDGCQVWRYDGDTSWTQVNQDGFGEVENVVASSMLVFDGYLYAGTYNNTGCQVWRYNGDSNWMKVGDAGLVNPWNAEVASLAEYEGKMYAGTYANAFIGGPACAVARYDGDTDWTQVNDNGFKEPRNWIALSMASYGGMMYVGTLNFSGSQVWGYNETDWNNVVTQGYSNNGNMVASAMLSEGDSIYVGTESRIGCEVWKRDAAGWTRLSEHGFGNPYNEVASSMAFYNGKLHVGTFCNTGCQVWRYDDGNWTNLEDEGFGNQYNRYASSMAVMGGKLYVGTGDDLGEGGSCEVWCYDGNSWNRVNQQGFGNPDYNAIANVMTVWDSNLYVGTEVSTNMFGQPMGSAEIWKYNGNDWNQVWSGFGHTLAVSSAGTYESKPYFGTEAFPSPQPDHGGCEVYRYDGGGFDDFTLVNQKGFGDWRNGEATAMATHESKLYVGTYNSHGGCQVFSYDGSSFKQENVDGFGTGYNQAASAMAVNGPDLFVGTDDSLQGCEVWMTHSSHPHPPHKYRWYLAEGSTGSNETGGFETWVLVENLSGETADVVVTYMTPTGEVAGPAFELEPESRSTVEVAQTVENNWSVSTEVESDQPIVVERSMFWESPTQGFRLSAHGSIGVSAPSLSWYLAEGSTGFDETGSFETWVLVQNPGNTRATAQLTFMTSIGEVEGPAVELEPGTRDTVKVADYVDGDWQVSTRVESDVPVIAERSMYWSTPTIDRQCAHDSIGATHPAAEWYIAEGSTGSDDNGSFETWVLVQNPGKDAADVEVTYMTEHGEVYGPRFNLAPGTRTTLDVSDTVEDDFSVAAHVVSDKPVVAERSVYWSTPDTKRQAAQDSIGSTIADMTWNLAEGSTGEWTTGSFETWVLILNPTEDDADIRLSYMTDEGVVKTETVEVQARSRRTVDVAEKMPGVREVSTKVTSDKPVVVERAMYWNTDQMKRRCSYGSVGFAP